MQKINLDHEYPCPCRRKGLLQPIVLTEALGCNRCQQIFVVDETGQTIEQLSTTYPYKRVWRWTGTRWVTANPTVSDRYLPIALTIIVMLLIVWLPLALRSPSGLSVIFWVMLAVLLALLPAFMVWLSYRR
ncbi:hypothetical protein K4A83_01235 [Spirulina subsalsa FACHB-351]|uniref:Uncharacterized protein n=1 Tax=Spirulina subsalsa FACHB-351 TaxID=234711 RepID=A0ABT3L1A0_9CYAN|nr:hypothetical protein [Spirulina subsalsa]MCW6034899.1 hypothetical protein [Spirulina subsalsa FACHB-351]